MMDADWNAAGEGEKEKQNRGKYMAMWANADEAKLEGLVLNYLIELKV